MRKVELDRFRKRLVERRQQLVGSVQHIVEESRRGSSSKISPDHLADAGAESFDQELNFQIMEMSQDELRAIEDALERMDEGTYGKCDSCEKSIPLPRLRASPYARLCIECKRAEEQSDRR